MSLQPSPEDANLRSPLYARALSELYEPRPAKKVVPLGQKEELYTLAAEVIGDLPITYLEFGVHAGHSLSRMLQQFRHPDARFFGFDSFEGLPEAWTSTMGVGHFSTGGKTPSVADPRAAFVKGWFQNTVPGFLASHQMSAPVLIHFDADLYSSSLFLLTTIWHHIPEYYFIFDEFSPDEIIALYDFNRAYPAEYEFIGCTQDEYARPQQVFGHMRKVPFTL